MDGSDSGERRPNSMESVANDALQLFRLNIFIIAVYSSIVGLLLQNDPSTVNDIVNSPYTLVGFIFWIGTTTSTILTYRGARKYSTAQIHSNPERVYESYDPEIIVRNVTVNAFGMLAATLALLFGFLDGNSFSDLPIWIPVIIVLSSVGIVGFLSYWFPFYRHATEMTGQGKKIAAKRASTAKGRLHKLSDGMMDYQDDELVESDKNN